MVSTPRIRQQPTQETPQAGDATERIELLRMRGSSDPVAWTIALLGSQLLRRLDELAKAAA